LSAAEAVHLLPYVQLRLQAVGLLQPSLKSRNAAIDADEGAFSEADARKTPPLQKQSATPVALPLACRRVAGQRLAHVLAVPSAGSDLVSAAAICQNRE
jgi:hypothetical protein